MALHEMVCGPEWSGPDESDVKRYEEDGVVLLRNVFTEEEIKPIRKAVEAAKESKGGFRANMGAKGGWVDKFRWRHDQAYRDLIFHPVMTRAVAKLIRSPSMNLLYDHTCAKEPGDVAPTLWHHDINYLPVEPPHHFASAWVALDDVEAKQGRLEFVRASHKWKNEDGTSMRFQPMDFPTMKAVDDDEWPHPDDPTGKRKGFTELPDVEASREKYEVCSADMKAGDVVVFQGLTLHYSAGNHDPVRPRRAVSLRYCGKDARYTPRNKEIVSGFPKPISSLLRPGDPLTCEIFPVVFDEEKEERVPPAPKKHKTNNLAPAAPAQLSPRGAQEAAG